MRACEERDRDGLGFDLGGLNVHDVLGICAALDNYRLLQIGVYAQLANMFFPIVHIRSFISRRANIQTRHREFLFRLIKCRGFIVLFGEGNPSSVSLLLELNLRHVLASRADFGVFVDQVEATGVQRGESVDTALSPTKICKHLRRYRLTFLSRAAHVRHHKEVDPILLLNNIVLVSSDFVRVGDCIFLPHPLRRINFIHLVD